MPITPGTRLAPYALVARMGSGGRSEGCRARDGTLGRDVALKVLSPALAVELNHPNSALVMELAEGTTLARRIAPGPIPIGSQAQTPADCRRTGVGARAPHRASRSETRQRMKK
jgi:serine/threonine protein kinase